MGCCVGEKHSNWCEDYDIVYIDAEGKEYCIFHAPAECKFDVLYDERDGGEKPALMEAEQFNGLVFARIDGVIEAGEDEKRDEWNCVRWNPRCNFKKTIFPYYISFDNYCGPENSLPPINFDLSRFLSDVGFWVSDFQNEASFYHAQFHGKSFICAACFKKQVSFEGSIFHKLASFSSIQANDKINFHNALFKHNLSFFNCSFQENAIFDNINTHQEASFKKNKFNSAQFYGIKFNGPVLFQDSIFKHKISFENSIFHDYANFSNNKFEGEATYQLAFFKEWAYFRNTEFLSKTSFSGAISKERILFESVDLTNFKFTETNIESFKFIDCNWGEERFAPIYDERTQNKSYCNDTTLAEIYRRLKKIARESADEEQTSHWHYREKEMTRKSLEDTDSTPFWNILITTIFMIPACAFFLKMHHEYFLNFAVGISLLLTAIGIGYNDFKKIRKDISKVASKLYLNTYKKISGYGEDPIRAGVILFGIVILPFIIKFIASLFPGGPSDWLKEAMWYMPLIKINLNDSQGYHYLLKGLSVTAITLQAALFGFALRNKLRR